MDREFLACTLESGTGKPQTIGGCISPPDDTIFDPILSQNLTVRAKHAGIMSMELGVAGCSTCRPSKIGDAYSRPSKVITSSKVATLRSNVKAR
jgi:hypothetical protein